MLQVFGGGHLGKAVHFNQIINQCLKYS